MKFHGVFLILAAISILFVGCAENVANPPEEKTTYAIADYFPLQMSDEWTWGAHSRDSIPEPYRDGDSCLGEPFIDVNGNGVYDLGVDGFISYCGDPTNQDFNCNGGWDGPNTCGQVPDVPFVDFNGNGTYDFPEGQYDIGELYLDLNEDGTRDYTKEFDVKMTVSGRAYSYYDGSPYMVLASMYDTVGLICYRVEYVNGFSLDTLGLRWHSHSYFAGWYDILKYGDVKPIVISAESLQVGYSHTQADTFWADTLVWTSTLIGVEDVTVQAGTFNDCLKFRFIASGWTESMEKFNGTSYWWLAKDVGLVKVQGPETESWVLKEYNLK